MFLAILGACSSSLDEIAAPLDGEIIQKANITAREIVVPFEDFDPYDWSKEKRSPSDYQIHGIDVARYQADIDWHKVKAAGIEFAFIKATEGGDMIDEKFEQNWHGSAKAGIHRGAYHFYYFCRPAHEQAKWFIDNVPQMKGTLPPVLDMEWNHLSPTCKLRPPAATVRNEMKVFIDMIKKHYLQTPIIYTTPKFYKENKLYGHFADVTFWLRSVASHPDTLYPGQKWVFWQYTGTGKVPGVEGKTDINVFYGDKKLWQDWLGANQAK